MRVRFLSLLFLICRSRQILPATATADVRATIFPKMLSDRLDNYLKTHRRRAALSQAEVAFLLGGVSGENVSRHEQCQRLPTLDKVFAYEVIYGRPARELFAGRYQQVESRVLKQVSFLAFRMSKKAQMPEIVAKREALRKILKTSRIKR